MASDPVQPNPSDEPRWRLDREQHGAWQLISPSGAHAGWVYTSSLAEFSVLLARVSAPAPDPDSWDSAMNRMPFGTVLMKGDNEWHEFPPGAFTAEAAAGVGGVPAEPQPPADASWLKTEDIGGLGIREMLRRRRERRAGAVPQDRKAGQ